ncbi:MAG: MarR family transcriptional regulator, partial [Deltaproteobacteria bacterium]|nr:MarR family transcriptional regulator [Deltaproteobacteria bacterium]
MHPDKDIPVILISRIREKANRFLVSELKSHNMASLAPSHGDILWALFKHGALSMKGLAELIDRDKSTVTALVNKLIFLGYVRKEPDFADSRVNIISLTDEGRDMKDDLIEISQNL